MSLTLPSCYSKEYWNAVKERVNMVLKKPTLEKLLEKIKEISEIKKCPKARSLSDMDKLSQAFSSHFMDNKRLGRAVIETICKLALNLEDLFPWGYIETLQSSKQAMITLGTTQAHCLLANMFLGTLRCCTEEAFAEKKHENGCFSFASRMSFTEWYSSRSYPSTDIYIHAMLSMFQDHASGQAANRNVAFERRVLMNEPCLSKCDFPVVPVHVHLRGRIGDIPEIEVDFANACVGGGPGGTQEELLLGTSPEALLVGILNSDPLLDNESVVITGAKKYADYKGFGLDAKYVGESMQKWNWSCRKIVAIDAIWFQGSAGENRLLQMQERNLKREIDKCYVGFLAGKGCGISTGHWGCGAFGGDKEIKAIIQVIAGSMAQVKHLNFFTFGDEQFAAEFVKMLDAMKRHDVKVRNLWEMLLEESRQMKDPVSFKESYDPDPYLFNKITSGLDQA